MSEQYNYVLSAAMDIGTALSALLIFFALDLPGVSLSWWGNDVYKNSELLPHSRSTRLTIRLAIDWTGASALRIAPETGFGPDTWKV